MVAERDEPTGALVQPYDVTRGRTRPRLEIALEALVETTVRGRNSGGRDGPQHGREQQYIASLCDGRLQSLAEVAAQMKLPLGVARVLVADMAAEGLGAVHERTSLENINDAGGAASVERVLSGL